MLSKEIERFKSGIYKITNLVNSKIYVGSSINIYNRRHTHTTKLNKNIHSSRHLQSSYNKYGRHNFLFEVIEYCSKEVLTEREQYWIDALKPEYNKRLIVERNTGLPISESARVKISETLKTRYRNGLKAYRQVHTWIPIDVYDLEGKFIQSYSCMKDAKVALSLKGTHSNRDIRRVCNAKMAKLGNYIFRYKNSEPPGPYYEPHNVNFIIKNLLTDEILEFSSKKEFARYLGISNLKTLKTKQVYKNKYQVIYVQNKQGELLENPVKDNQQPSLLSNEFEGSTTNSQVLNKDGNGNTSTLQPDNG